MMEGLEAGGFAVCRIRRFAGIGEERVDLLLGSLKRGTHETLNTIGEEVRDHMGSSLLPFCWGGEHDVSDDAAPFLKPVSLPEEALSGVGFPAKLGVMGNGFAAFFGQKLRLDAERLVHLHQSTYAILRDLLHLDVSKSSPMQGLNERELQCLQLAADGFKSEKIAEELGLSIHTVNAYLGTAAARLDAVNRIQAIAKAMRLGYIG